MADLGPEIANKVLAANTRNVVKHVGEGGRLSPAERDLMQAETVTALTEQEMKRARIGALMLKWAKGQRLSKDEKEEIASALPSSRAEARSMTASAYTKTMQEYATIYGYTDRAVKAWIKDGREASGGADLPPLDEPTKMAAWYARVKKRRVPGQLLKFSSTAPEPSSVPKERAAAPTDSAAPGVAFEFNADDFGYDLAVRFAAENLGHAQEQLRQARKTPENTGRIEECERSVTRALSEYRKAKNDEQGNMGKHMVDKRLMLDKFRAKLGGLHQGVRSCPVRVATKLALPPDVVRLIIKTMNDELDALFIRMNDDRWAYKEALTLEP